MAVVDYNSRYGGGTPQMKGENAMGSAKKLYVHRRRYDFYSGVSPFPTVKDFLYAENLFYGRVDDNYMPMFLNKDFLRPIDSGEQNVSDFKIVYFGQSQIEKMRSDLQKMVLQKKIDTNNRILSNLTIKRAYEDPEKKFENYLNIFSDMFNKEYLLRLNRDENIRNFSDYLNEFLHFMKDRGKKFPMIFSSWMQSKYSSPYVSGLFFDIGGHDRGNDGLKVSEYLENENFEIIQNLATRNGFHVAKHAPYILSIDIASPVTKKYIEKMHRFSSTDTQSVIRTLYKPCWTIDIELLKRALIRFYNQLVGEKDYIITPQDCQAKYNKKTGDLNMRAINNNKIYRIPVRRYEADKILTSRRMINIYFNIRNQNEQNIFQGQEYERILSNALKYQNFVDNKEAIRYINNEFIEKYKHRKGGDMDYQKRVNLVMKKRLNRVKTEREPVDFALNKSTIEGGSVFDKDPTGGKSSGGGY